MVRNVTEYKTCGDLMGAIKQALRRFTPSGTCLIQIENIYYENKVSEQDLLITDGINGIRITEIPEDDLNKLKTKFTEIATPYVYKNGKWYSVFADPYYTDGIIEELEEMFSSKSDNTDNLF